MLKLGDRVGLADPNIQKPAIYGVIISVKKMLETEDLYEVRWDFGPKGFYFSGDLMPEAEAQKNYQELVWTLKGQLIRIETLKAEIKAKEAQLEKLIDEIGFKEYLDNEDEEE